MKSRRNTKTNGIVIYGKLDLVLSVSIPNLKCVLDFQLYGEIAPCDNAIFEIKVIVMFNRLHRQRRRTTTQDVGKKKNTKM